MISNMTELQLISQLAAIIALMIGISILTSSTMTLILNMIDKTIKFDSDGNMTTRDPDVIDLRKRMLRFPGKASKFYYIALVALMAIVLLNSLSWLLEGIVVGSGMCVVYYLKFLTSSIVYTILLTIASSYASFLGHTIFVYKRIYAKTQYVPKL